MTEQQILERIKELEADVLLDLRDAASPRVWAHHQEQAIKSAAEAHSEITRLRGRLTQMRAIIHAH